MILRRLTAECYGKINKNHRAFVGWAQQKPGFSPNLRAATKYFRKKPGFFLPCLYQKPSACFDRCRLISN